MSTTQDIMMIMFLAGIKITLSIPPPPPTSAEDRLGELWLGENGNMLEVWAWGM